MMKTLTASTRALRGFLGAASLVAFAASTASAQITFAGSTQFRLGNSGLFSNSVALGGTQGDGLSFTGANFSVTTLSTGPFTSTGVIPGTAAALSNLGKVFLKDRYFDYGGSVVQMLVTFTAPSVGGPQTFTSLLSGLVRNSTILYGATDYVFIDWQSGVGNVPFWNGPGSGTFAMNVYDQQVFLGVHTGYIGGDISTTLAPEPASLALLGTGLIGVIGVAARRRKKA